MNLTVFFFSAEPLQSSTEASDSGEVNFTLVPEQYSHGKENGTIDDVSMAPTYGGGENSNSGTDFTIGDLDQPIGSGMQPTLSEKETFTPTASVGEPGETQPVGGNGRENEKTQDDGCKKIHTHTHTNTVF